MFHQSVHMSMQYESNSPMKRKQLSFYIVGFLFMITKPTKSHFWLPLPTKYHCQQRVVSRTRFHIHLKFSLMLFSARRIKQRGYDLWASVDDATAHGHPPVSKDRHCLTGSSHFSKRYYPLHGYFRGNETGRTEAKERKTLIKWKRCQFSRNVPFLWALFRVPIE